MPLTPAARLVANRQRKPRVKEKLYMITVHPGEAPLPVVATGFKCDLAGNLMLYHYGSLQVFKTWETLKQADFDDPAEPEADPVEAEPA